MMKKSVVFIFLLLLGFFTSGYLKPDVYEIDAQQNAINHNSMGLQYVMDGNYYNAIQEFCLAIALNPNTQATAVYYNNLGETYMKTGYYKEAQKCFENSITQYSLNFLYYQNLVNSFKAQKIIPSKIKLYTQKAEKNPMYMIVLGLLYVENVDTRRGIIKLDEFCMQEPELLITSAVRNYIQSIVPKD
jgi:tetratricopeptide (TPR) repeat protein